MGKRVQVTVPDRWLPAWTGAAETTGVSLSTWIVMRVNRPDTAKILDLVMSKLDEVRQKPEPRPLAIGDEEEWMIKELQHRLSTAARPVSFDQALRIAVRQAYSDMSIRSDHVRDVLEEPR